MSYRAAVEQQGKGKNNETSEDNTKPPSTSSPLPRSFVPSRAWRCRTVTHSQGEARYAHGPPLPTCPAPSPHTAVTAALAISVSRFLFRSVFEYYYSSHNYWFPLCAFSQELCISVWLFFHWGQIFLPQRLMMLICKQEIMGERVMHPTLQYSLHFSDAFLVITD